MQEVELLREGLGLMGLGMGFVFVFLTFLVISITLMSKAIGRFQPISIEVRHGREETQTPAINNHDEEVLAILSVAVHRYRSSRR